MGQSNQTLESQELESRPEIREQVEKSPEFQSWRDELPTLDIDGERFYLPWGDIPMDVDQIVYHWARSHGLLGSTESSENDQPGAPIPPSPPVKSEPKF
jgi:hypothetical protein